MAIKLKLTAAQIAELDTAAREATNAETLNFIQIVRLTAQGLSREAVMKATQTCKRSIQRWLNRYLQRGVAGLKREPGQGAKPILRPEQAPLIRQWVIEGPAACGCTFANWTYANLAAFVSERLGISITGKVTDQANGQALTGARV